MEKKKQIDIIKKGIQVYHLYNEDIIEEHDYDFDSYMYDEEIEEQNTNDDDLNKKKADFYNTINELLSDSYKELEPIEKLDLIFDYILDHNLRISKSVLSDVIKKFIPTNSRAVEYYSSIFDHPDKKMLRHPIENEKAASTIGGILGYFNEELSGIPSEYLLEPNFIYGYITNSDGEIENVVKKLPYGRDSYLYMTEVKKQVLPNFPFKDFETIIMDTYSGFNRMINIKEIQDILDNRPRDIQ